MHNNFVLLADYIEVVVDRRFDLVDIDSDHIVVDFLELARIGCIVVVVADIYFVVVQNNFVLMTVVAGKIENRLCMHGDMKQIKLHNEFS